MPANYHQTVGVLSSPSRPLTPGQQFQKIDEFQILTMPTNRGQDDSSDLKVVSTVLTIPAAYDPNCTFSATSIM